MAVVIIILIILILFIATVVNGADSAYRSNTQAVNTEALLNELINVQKIEETARGIMLQEGVTHNEAIYFSISSLLELIRQTPIIDKQSAGLRVYSIIQNDYPYLQKVIEQCKPGNFDFIEHIALNAKHIVETEGKSRDEAVYIAICMFYDDLSAKGSKTGIYDLLEVTRAIYPDIEEKILKYAGLKN